jgi:hypothetical protein
MGDVGLTRAAVSKTLESFDLVASVLLWNFDSAVCMRPLTSVYISYLYFTVPCGGSDISDFKGTVSRD